MAIDNTNTIEERRLKMNRNSVFYCHLLPFWQQMAIENTVSIDFWSMFVNCWLRFRLLPTRCENIPLKTWSKLETPSTYTYLRSRWNSHGLVLYDVSLTTGEHDGRYCGFWTVRDGGTLGWGLKDKERISLGIALDKALFTFFHQLFP